MKAITIEDLKTKFVVSKVAPYGEVIMVPGADFDPDWESVLEEEGFGCVFTEINSEKFTLVRLEEGEEESTAEPRPVLKREDSGKFARRGAPPGKKVNPWNDADEGRLLKRIEEMPGTIEEKVAQLLSEFPGRTATGLLKKYQKLKRKLKKKVKAAKGKCPKCGLALDLCTCAEVERESERSEEKRLRDANREQARKRVESEEHVSVESAGAQLDVPKALANLEDRVKELISRINTNDSIISRELTHKLDWYAAVLSKFECAIQMQALEQLERQGGCTIPAALRDHYLDVLTKPDPKYVQLFIDKVLALLEASS